MTQRRTGFLSTMDTRERIRIIAVPAIVVASVCALGYFLFIRSQDVMKDQLSERLTIMATLGAMQFDGNHVKNVRNQTDMGTPSFKILLDRVQKIRKADPRILYTYIMRKTDDPNILSFVVDADSALTNEELDKSGNSNGFVDEDEKPGLPGEKYDASAPELVMLRTEAFDRPTVDQDITRDKWGSYISGYAPIKDTNGVTVGVLGIDMDAGQFTLLSRSIFSPLLLLVVVLVGVMIAAYILYVWNTHNVNTLKKIDKERSGLLQLTFHQLGEPITIMQWSLETLSENLSLQQLEQVVPEHITTMNEGLRRLNGIIDTLQFAEKIDLGSIEFKPMKIALAPILEELSTKYKMILSASQQTLAINCDPSIMLFADKELLTVVLSEVIGNAIAYSTKNCTVDVRVHPDTGRIHIDIQDHGCGIPKKDMTRLFEKYMRGSNAHLHKPDGNGLGLYICKGIVDGMDGDITVESQEDVGTKVSIALPQ